MTITATRISPLALALLTLVSTPGCNRPAQVPDRTLAIADLLAGEGGGEVAGFERATTHRNFRFPEDHGPHDGFRTEWWYYTGNLATVEGRRFGYQLTFFKTALIAEPSDRGSAWAADQVLMAHFAVTDPRAGRFHSHERFSRRALGLAGAIGPGDPEGGGFRVWVEDWAASGNAEMRLAAAEAGVEIDLRLEPGKPPVLQGDAGLSRKGAGEGNASYYYSMTRMPTRGTISVDGRTHDVTGASWMDREWSTSVLEDGQVGWDWFALQLADGPELMLGQIRRADGSADRHSAGTWIAENGDYRRLAMADWTLTPLERWVSPESQVDYPSRWKIEVPSLDLELEVRPLLPDQELRHAFRYWEGAVEAEGRRGGEPVTAAGYVELTGYE